VVQIADTITDRSARGIAAAVSQLIGAGDLQPGDRLPTVRELARDLGVSAGTVSEAWQTLSRVGVIAPRGRAGTVVLERRGGSGPTRYRRLAPGSQAVARDLSSGIPDALLLPDLGPLLRRIGGTALSSSYLDRPVLPALEELLLETWPFTPGGITVVDGALDALSRVTDIVVAFGDRVVVESPAFPPLLDLLDRVGAETIGVEVDAEGMVPASLAQALSQHPVAVYLQPRAHNPTGSSISPGRAAALARVLRGHDLTVIEDDHSGDIATADDVTLGRELPERVLHIRSYSKSHGPDLRIAAVGGSADLIDRLVERRMLGPGWTSRMLQSLLVELLTDRAAIDSVAHARDTYRRRQCDMAEALTSRGVDVKPADGINQWIPVVDERLALVSAAASGIGVAPGTPFIPSGGVPDRDHVRVTVGLVDDDVERVADCLAAAAAPGSSSAGV